MLHSYSELCISLLLPSGEIPDFQPDLHSPVHLGPTYTLDFLSYAFPILTVVQPQCPHFYAWNSLSLLLS